MTKLSEQIAELQAQGKSYNQIQVELGCSKGTISYHLGAGQKEKNLDRQRDRRNSISKFVQEYKQSRVCADCKENYPYWIMQFDHLGNKSFNISEFRTSAGSLKVVQQEIEKCELVCANCHANRTHLRLITTGDSTPDISEFYN